MTIMYKKFLDVKLLLFLTRNVLSWLEFMQYILTPLLRLCILIFLNPHRALYEIPAVAVSIAEFFPLCWYVFIMARTATTSVISVKRRLLQ
jgi:hypothetical protein